MRHVICGLSLIFILAGCGVSVPVAPFDDQPTPTTPAPTRTLADGAWEIKVLQGTVFNNLLIFVVSGGQVVNITDEFLNPALSVVSYPVVIDGGRFTTILEGDRFSLLLDWFEAEGDDWVLDNGILSGRFDTVDVDYWSVRVSHIGS